ncbi:hypothetical protein [Rhizobium sp. AAP43]|uniref:hypothetical protein n=1 Tax=Rhizobium sp. AAP43 TaxID=1523420 RepID=UPI0006B8D545|nr:hypothetical protein [Rhizobium sp. AAP43]KPF43495.1 hypothetical protein IP76_14210 [Rhizobium sp. AAP43]
MDRSWFRRGVRFLRALSPIATLTTFVVISLLGQSGADTLRRLHPVASDTASYTRVRGEASAAAGQQENRLLLASDSSTRNKARPADSSGDGIVPVISLWLPDGSSAIGVTRIPQRLALPVPSAYRPRAPPLSSL